MESAKYITKHIDRLLLDPNNYRFRDHPDYRPVEESDLADPRIQLRTYNLLVGRTNNNIQDLIKSFKANGVLKLDPIQVRPLDERNFLVIEGNRRTAALKFLWEEYKRGNDVGILTESSFRSVELVSVQDESPEKHLITMGLHHISGKAKWNPVNQAQLIWDLRNKYGQSEEQIMDSLSITKHSLRRSLRTLSLIKRYRASDFGDQFRQDMYSFFEEAIKNTKIKVWLKWDDDEMAPQNIENEERFFSWISKQEEVEEPDSDNPRTVMLDPIITKSHEIRDLAKFIQDKKAVAEMEESRSISSGFALSDAVGEHRFYNALDNLQKEVNAAFQFSEYMKDADVKRIGGLRDKLDRLIPSSQAIIESRNTKRVNHLFTSFDRHFDRLYIHQYRKLQAISVESLSRVNIFAGGNNTGKTTLLEAFYLISQFNHMNSFLELQRYKGKFHQGLSATWLDHNFNLPVSLEATFNQIQVHLSIEKEQAAQDVDKLHYLSTIAINAQASGETHRSQLNLYDNREPELYSVESKVLCAATFTSPYRYNADFLSRAYEQAITEKYLDEVIAFIRDKMDPNIEKIDLIPNGRFMVSARQFEQAVDITKYGEGLQRVFEIALLMGYSRDGIICIDELDSAIHKSLLVDFTQFIQQAARTFNVQVFLSTHSKECIDAFVENDFHNEDITAYALTEENGSIVCRYLPGTRLEELVEAIDIDIR